MAAYQVEHDKAVASHSTTYLDPETGYTCFTELAHLRRYVMDPLGTLIPHCWQFQKHVLIITLINLNTPLVPH